MMIDVGMSKVQQRKGEDFAGWYAGLVLEDIGSGGESAVGISIVDEC